MSISRLLTLLARFESGPSVHGSVPSLPKVLVLTDPNRGYDMETQATRWPSSCALIERTFGARPSPKPHERSTHIRLATCTPQQARAARLDGIHWPEKQLGQRKRSAVKGLLETCSAHSGLALAKAARAGFDGILVSTVFKSDSPSAGRPKGAIRLARLQQAFPAAPIYALGGVTLQTTKRLTRTKIRGVALVSFK